MARLNGVHAFGYNSAESEPIWMKFGALRVHCLLLALADFGCDIRSSESERAEILFFFGEVSNARFHRLPVGQISRNFHTRCSLWWFN